MAGNVGVSTSRAAPFFVHPLNFPVYLPVPTHIPPPPMPAGMRSWLANHRRQSGGSSYAGSSGSGRSSVSSSNSTIQEYVSRTLLELESYDNCRGVHNLSECGALATVLYSLCYLITSFCYSI
ncbi:hypothetical protein AB6A40_009207 [Gnathostoma spinigerum]|uniref:Uncharacterized protein n=1 Tax=Gnathostoma spinigerum TaxID=75299 RepID=A0ABD6EZE9_9BILA